ncbi:alpha/beta hydrolase [Streptomyces sp. 4N509B]|uniref:alpha/beta hydrolase n=1 Tax=Streptomyces sp. 4N509B TaxID=3457413 RepID=UPI003FD08B28
MTTGRTRTVALAGTLALLLTAGAAGCTNGGAPEDREPIDGVQRPNEPAPAGEAEEPPPVPGEFRDQTLSWGECGAPTVRQGGGEAPEPLPDGTAWECATLTVPLDYAEPEGDTIEIALIRAPAPEGREGLGSLVFNFGGPGGSGVATLPRASEQYRALHEGGYDLVSFDPRGVGASSPVVCLTGAEIDRLGQEDDGAPRTEAEVRELVAEGRAYADACEENAGEVLPHVTTENAARDLDLLRQALGEKHLNYFGVSYGTKLGGVYAHHFPERVGRAVFDAVVDPTRDVVQRALLQAEGFDLALDNYLDDCAATEPACPTGERGAGPHAYQVINELLADLRQRPARTDTSRELTQGLAVGALLTLLYSEDSWPYLTAALAELRDTGRGDLLLAAAESYNGRDEQGRYSNLHSANRAINCADFSSRPTLATVRAHEAEFERVSPVFGPQLVWSLLSCLDWPVTGERDQPEVEATGAQPILLLGTTGDPATPYVGAERMREALGEDVGVLLTYEGEGHGAYGGGDACVTDAVNAHLLSGTLPRDGTVCP